MKALQFAGDFRLGHKDKKPYMSRSAKRPKALY